MRLFAPSLLFLCLACSDKPTPFVDDAPIVAQRDVQHVVYDLLESQGLIALDGAVLEAGALSPSGQPTEEGGDRPALMMKRGQAFAFDVPDVGGPFTFRTAFGMDYTARDLNAAVRMGFEVLVNGEQVADILAGGWPGMKVEAAVWQGFEGSGKQAFEAGLEVPSGAHVEVRARLETWKGAGECPPLKAGLAMPRLIETVPVPVRAASEERPNIVVIVMDTQRRDSLSCYGSNEGVSPNIDALAARGLVFDDAYATGSWTWPSTASMLTGLLPEEHLVTDTDSCYLSSSINTLPELLRAQGYATSAFIGNPLISPRRNFDQGFDKFWLDQANFRFSGDVFPNLSKWLGEHKDERFFCYLQLVDTHDPYTPMEKFGGLHADSAPPNYPYTAVIDYGAKLRKQYAGDPNWEDWLEPAMPAPYQEHLKELYSACVQSGDDWVGSIVERLSELGLADNTLIVFTSDHGEELLDHGLLGHGQSLHAELTGVPLIFAGPGVTAGRHAGRVANRNLAGTLAAVGGAQLDATGAAQDLLRPAELEERPVFLSSQHGLRGAGHSGLYGVRYGKWFFSMAPSAKAPHEEFRLFDVEADPLEMNNLAASMPGKVAELRALVEARLKRSASQTTAARLGAGDGTKDQFGKIGYADK